MHDLNSKNLHIDGLFFFQKKKHFLGDFGHYSQNEIFPKIQLRQLFILKAPQLHEKFQKILQAVLEKTRLPTGILTAVKSSDPISPKGEGPILKRNKNLFHKVLEQMIDVF